MILAPIGSFGRRCAVASGAMLIAMIAAAVALAADDAAKSGESPAMLSQLGAFAKQVYRTLDEKAVGPSLRAAQDAITAPATQRLFGQIGDAANALADTAGATMRPIAAEAGALLTGPQARQSYETAGALAQDIAAGLRHYVVDPVLAATGARPQAAMPARSGTPPPAVLAATPPYGNFGPLDEDLRAAVEADDPLEGFNRLMFDLNDRLRVRLFHPVTDFYLRTTTPPVQAGVRNFFANLREPVTIASSLLEGEFRDAGNATARFGLNTTVGIVGIFDPAAAMGYPAKMRDLEETLCVYGLPSGPYLVLPIFGPGTIRDAAGRLTTLVAYYEAMGVSIYVPYRITDIAVQSIDVQRKLTLLDSISVDPYVTQRAIYLTARKLNCGRQGPVEREFFTK